LNTKINICYPRIAKGFIVRVGYIQVNLRYSVESKREKEKDTGYIIKYRGWKAAPAAPRRRDVSRRSSVAQQVHAAPSATDSNFTNF